MTGREFLEYELKHYPNKAPHIHLRGLLPSNNWWHIHLDEELPDDYPVAIVFSRHFNMKFAKEKESDKVVVGQIN